MCTLVLLRRPGHDWPVIVAANRDEAAERPWRPPARHWPDRPDVVAGRDLVADGSWLGLNDAGVVAGVLNRPGTLGPLSGKRSRGELVLDALDHADAAEAARALSELNPAAFRGFHLVIADDREAYWLSGDGGGGGRGVVTVRPLPEGVTMLTAAGPDRDDDPRIAAFLPRFRAAPPPEPEAGDFAAWEALLAESDPPPGAPETAAMSFRRPDGYGTTSSSLIALPSTARSDPPQPVWRFAYGRPDAARFRTVDLGAGAPPTDDAAGGHEESAGPR